MNEENIYKELSDLKSLITRVDERTISIGKRVKVLVESSDRVTHEINRNKVNIEKTKRWLIVTGLGIAASILSIYIKLKTL